LVFGLAAALLCLWCAVTWVDSGVVAEERKARLIERERTEANIRAESIVRSIDDQLELVRNLPLVIAKESQVVSLLERFGPAVASSSLPAAAQRAQWRTDSALREWSRQLSDIVAETKLNVLFTLDAAGDCLAEGHSAENVDTAGVNYADRDYFRSARLGLVGHQYAIGRITSFPGLFYAAPVMNRGQFIGAVGARLNVARLSRHLTGLEAFVTDENGVIVMSEGAAQFQSVLPGAKVFDLSPEERSQRYGQAVFDTVSLAPWRADASLALLRWQGKAWPYVVASQSTVEGVLTVYVLRSLEAISDIEQDRLWRVGLLWVIGFLAISLAVLGIGWFKLDRKLRRDLARQARTDALTGCANRRHFLTVLAAEKRRWERYARPFSLLSLDIDHFKEVNDRYGHPAGDQVLRHFVEVVKASLRPCDLVGRMGGEEFAALLPETKGEDAAGIAERVRSAVEGSPVLFLQTSISVTVSIGVSEWRGESDTLDDLLGRGDKALYAAKNAGRNRLAVEGFCA
jgi:diguanylate cyclase (GGDEF)-like protein